MTEHPLERVRSDAGLRAVLRTARAWGVSPRRLLGWEPATTTVFERDAAGRVARTVTTVEAEWDDQARDLAAAYEAWLADLCPGCNQPMAETTARENEGRYVAMKAIRCHSCTASSRGARAYEESPDRAALFIPVQLAPEVTG